MSQRLPDAPHLDHLRKQAKDVLRVARRRLPEWRLSDAQHALARGYGFARWEELKLRVDECRPVAGDSVVPASDSHVAGRPHAAHSERRGHAISGTWISDSPAIALECQLIAERLMMTQVTLERDGRHVAVKFTVVLDSVERPIPFGSGLMLRGACVDERTVRMVVSRPEGVVSEGVYEVSADGNTLRCHASAKTVVLARCADVD